MSNPDLTGKNILVALLNWGLGHATRSMPVIDLLRSWGANVILAGDGRSLHLLQNEYPDLPSVVLPPYNVVYTSGHSMVAVTLMRIPLYLTAVYKEHRMLRRLVKELNLDMVISDNRYGIWTSEVPSVFICHQLAIIPPEVVDWMSPAVFQLHKMFYNRFDQVWIPDFKGDENLTGRLTHKYALSTKDRFIGPLSRFMSRSPSSDPKYKADHVVVLSGPEPQRTLLEELIMKQVSTIEGDFLIVQGRTESFQEERRGNMQIVSFLNAEQLYDALAYSKVVISRSGYSTIMDLCFLGKKAVFIPTPGQTEQEYLGIKLQEQGMAVVQNQQSFDLKKALDRVSKINGFPKMEGNDELKKVVGEFTSHVFRSPEVKSF